MALSQAQTQLADAIDELVLLQSRTDTVYHRSLSKPRTLKRLSKKQRKQLQGPTQSTMKSINSAQAQQFHFSDGTVYMGLPARFMDVGLGGGYQKVGPGLPFVKVEVAA